MDFIVHYQGHRIGLESGSTQEEALAKLVARNPHHIPERFKLTAMELTKEAAEGFDWAKARDLGTKDAREAMAPDFKLACPYIHTSPSAMAWHLGRHMQANGWDRPTPELTLTSEGRVAVMTGRGDQFTLRGRKDTLLGRFRWQENNTFRELMD